MKLFSYKLSMVLVLLFPGESVVAKSSYDPLEISDRAKPEIINITFNDKERQRDVPIRVYLSTSTSSAPVILFSHGLGGSRKTSSYLGKHWAARGYVAVFVQHPGSDTSVWQGKQRARRFKALQEAANWQNFVLRVQDIKAVLNQLEQWNRADSHQLAGRLDLQRIGMSGHSFGAVTTQAVSGQRTATGSAPFIDSRIRAALILSPNGPPRASARDAFGGVEIPWMLMTGTKDLAPIGNATMKSRLAVFPGLSAGGKYELILFNAQHSAFTDRRLPREAKKRNPNHHRVILALSTAFWDTWLGDNVNARDWLDGGGPQEVMDSKDRWQLK